MSDLSDLHRAVLTSPDEDTPRLMYADQLEEEGRGDLACFIRDSVWAACQNDAVIVPIPPGHKVEFHEGVCDFTAVPAGTFKSCWAHKDYVLVEEFSGKGDPRKWAAAFEARPARFLGSWNGLYRFIDTSDPDAVERATRITRMMRFGVPWLLDLHDSITTNREFQPVVSRGFVEHLTCTADQWLEFEGALYWHPRQQIDCPECKGGYTFRTVPQGQVARRCQTCKANKGYVPRPVPEGAHPIRTVGLTKLDTGLLLGESVLSQREGGVNRWYADRWPGITFSVPEVQPGSFVIDSDVHQAPYVEPESLDIPFDEAH